MDTKVISFQITNESSFIGPQVIALCEDGSLWIVDLKIYLEDYQNGRFKWRKMTSIPMQPTEG